MLPLNSKVVHIGLGITLGFTPGNLDAIQRLKAYNLTFAKSVAATLTFRMEIAAVVPTISIRPLGDYDTSWLVIQLEGGAKHISLELCYENGQVLALTIAPDLIWNLEADDTTAN